ncbi:helix-turn-helix domain-containing protein [Sphingobacterium prati]|uniref:helix-turn-helix domain-containing protein n=1 Tax=Sphingobacterium prati TaxID=2737006 RepID=UPI001555F96D|nr:helix-turn-helix domain-containing protein [Sphingobacterium prati]NPE46159.1 helix-turn-helix domain-containing protein [Sphingobacterium prati]
MSNTLKDKAFPIMKNLKQIRNEKRLSQQELANLFGISLRTIQRMEKGESKGSPYVIRSLCQTLDVDPQVIYIESDIVHEKGPDQLLGTADIESISSIETDRDNAANIKYINFSSLIVLLIPFANLLSVPIFYFLFKKRLIDKNQKITVLKILSFQIIWSTATMLFMISTPLFTFWLPDIPTSIHDIPLFVWVYWLMLFVHVVTTLTIAGSLNKTDHPIQFIPNVL